MKSLVLKGKLSTIIGILKYANRYSNIMNKVLVIKNYGGK